MSDIENTISKNKTKAKLPRVYLDTNILVYAIDQRHDERNQKARKLLEELTQTHEIIVSTQVLQEFYVVCTKKLKIAPTEVENLINNFMTYLFKKNNVVSSDVDLILQGIQLSISVPLSLWDALVIAGAKRGNCPIMYSEDLNHGQSYQGVLVQNPFI
ncbi:MAG: PIN domain-containing protein [Moraxellaceae bacterium]|nr:PIN domain-containing protein [Moraxellaceae bacterium]